MKIKTNFTKGNNKFAEKNSGVSITIPDQAMSVQKILYNYAHGLPVTGAKVPIYDLDENGDGIPLPDLSRMDISEIHNLAESNMKRIKELQDEMRKGQTQAANDKLRAEMIAELEKAGWKKSEDETKVIPPDDQK